ncbi:MAG: NAD(P)-dependent alcohol dehydrogenase [Verrucomicrobiales bacterium]|nr:NAD(P)-dependent alcohol dehydrogenase [Verrucomicrobiales bacterium]
MKIRSFAAKEPKGKLTEFEYDPGELGPDEVEIQVDYCGLCHSDLSMWSNDWGLSEYPIVPGHEVSGRVVDKGELVDQLEIGQKVGLGWNSNSCQKCKECLSGNHNLCSESQATIVGRHGGFADRVRTNSLWAIPIPGDLDSSKVGPLFCGGITVFNPVVISDVSPTDRVGVVGIGGLGHMALQFLGKWGCEVTAFSTSPEKEESAKKLGAHHFVNTGDENALDAVANTLDFLLVTVNAKLDWEKYIATLRPGGKLHLVGAAPEVSSEVFPLIMGQKSIGASPLGSPATVLSMLEFSSRHRIAPETKLMPMSEINEAMKILEEESPSHRIVLENDFD